MAPSRTTQDVDVAYDPRLLEEYSYAQLRVFCKQFGLPSRPGKAVDLRARLLALIPSGAPVGMRATEGASAHAGAAREVAAAAREAAAAADLAAKALSTPLPGGRMDSKRLPRIKTRVDGRRGQHTEDTRRQSFLGYVLGKIVGVVLFVVFKGFPLLALVLYVLEKHLCEMPAFLDAGPVGPWSCDVASVASREAMTVVNRIAEVMPVDLKRLDLKTLLIKGVEDAHASTMQLLEHIEGKTKVPFEPLNKAVLEALMIYNSGLESVVAHLEDIWSGRHVSSEDKANVVLFACLTSEDCAELESDVSAVADAQSVLKLLVDDTTTRGEVQAQIASFLRETPAGVIVVPRVERWPPPLLSVLNNGMGEAGALIQDGDTIPTTSATWLLTARVDLDSEATKSSVDLSLRVKKALLEDKEEGDEMVQAVMMAFRRRLDVVALGTFVL
jgi:hypothetical protein